MAQAFQDVSKNPANIAKYQNNPKVQKVINKLAGKFGEQSPFGAAANAGGSADSADTGSAGTGSAKPPPSAADLQPDID